MIFSQQTCLTEQTSPVETRHSLCMLQLSDNIRQLH